MKALTIRQPWATLIALGVKTIETRSWRAPDALIGQCLAIHAGKHRPAESDLGCFSVRTLGAVGMYDLSHNCAWTPLPLGVVVATTTLADCVSMVTHYDAFDPECVVVNDGSLDHVIPPDADQSAAHGSALPDPGAALIRDISDQLPYGDFQPGRWAWMLTDVQACDPVPAKGKQGLWTWQP